MFVLYINVEKLVSLNSVLRMINLNKKSQVSNTLVLEISLRDLCNGAVFSPMPIRRENVVVMQYALQHRICALVYTSTDQTLCNEISSKIKTTRTRSYDVRTIEFFKSKNACIELLTVWVK